MNSKDYTYEDLMKNKWDEWNRHIIDGVNKDMAKSIKNDKNSVEYYCSLPYIRQLSRTEDEWFVKIEELPGCMSSGDTIEETREMIKDALKVWLEIAIEDGMDIPLPKSMNCPFCQGPAKVHMSDENDYDVHCTYDDCYLSDGGGWCFDSGEEAVKKWSRREKNF